MNRLDGPLSHQAQNLHPSATVWEHEEGFVLMMGDQKPINLGFSWGAARTALAALRRAQPSISSAPPAGAIISRNKEEQ